VYKHIYALNESMAFTAPIYAKLLDIQQIFVHIPRAELCPNLGEEENGENMANFNVQQ